MVWRVTTMTQRTELHICQENVTGFYYIDNGVEPIAVPYARRHGNATNFQDDNARAHCARGVKDHLQFRRITTLPWPAKSQDMTLMKHLWDILGRHVYRWPHKPPDINELADALQEKWCRILQATTGRLIRRIRCRCLACLAANGAPAHC